MSGKPAALGMDTVLARTSEGTRRMATREGDLNPKLRSALSLVAQGRSVGDLLDLAGGLAHVLEEQLRALLEMGLVVVVDRPSPAKPAEPVAVAAARIQLLGRIGAAAAAEASGAVDGLRAARSVAELARHARDAAVAIQQSAGRHAAEEFWLHARAILLHWQQRESRTGG